MVVFVWIACTELKNEFANSENVLYKRCFVMLETVGKKVNLFRPPGTTVPDGLMFYRRCFIYFFFRHAFSEVPRPIALKLCHVVGIWLCFIN